MSGQRLGDIRIGQGRLRGMRCVYDITSDVVGAVDME